MSATFDLRRGPLYDYGGPTQGGTGFNLGLGYRKLEPPQHVEALHYFRAALAITPQDAKLQMQVAKTYEDSGQLSVPRRRDLLAPFLSAERG